MNIKQAKIEIIHTVKAYLAKDENGFYRIPAIRQRPILLMGPPGIGKTQIMEQISQECRIGLVSYTITHHTRQSAVGLPFIKEAVFEGQAYSVTEYTMSEIIASIYKKIQMTGLKEGILFIDEINCVSETLAPTMLQFLQCKTFGNQPVPEGWIIVAAGNPQEYNKSVRDFDMVTLDRVRMIKVEPDLKIWKEYARMAHLNAIILSYLEIRPNHFYLVEADVDGLQFVTARGWEDLSHLMDAYECLRLPVTAEIIYEFLRFEEVAEEFAAYADLYHKYQDDYGIEGILAGKVGPQVFARLEQAAFDERLSVVNLLFNALQNRFLAIDREKYLTDLWYELLTSYRHALSDSKDPAITFERMRNDWQSEFEREKMGNLLERTKRAQKELLSKKLNHIHVSKGLAPQEAFQFVRQDFEEQREHLEQLETAASIALEYAFDFMEAAFSDGQEMVVFVTSLTIGKEAAAFLAEHSNQRYLKYNQQLLIGTRREQLLSELQRDELQWQ